MLHQAQEERQVGRVDALLVDRQDEAGRARSRGGSWSSRPPRRCPASATGAPELVALRGRRPARRRDLGVDRHGGSGGACRSGIGGARKVDVLLGEPDLLERRPRTARGRRRPPPRPGSRVPRRRRRGPACATPSSQPQSMSAAVRDQLGPRRCRSARATSTRRIELEELRRAHDQEQVDPRCDRRHRALPVGGGVADVLVARPLDRREAAPQRRHDARPCRRPRAWSGSNRRRALGSGTATLRRRPRVSTRSTEPSGTWPMVPITSGWPAWPISRTVRPGLVVPLDLAMDLGDQRAGGVGEQQPAPARLGRHRLGHAMGGEHDERRRPAPRRAPRRTRRPAPRSSSTTWRLWTISWRT